MTKQTIQTAILATSTIAAALLAIVGLGFSAPAGELSKLEYNGNMWCVSNWIEDEDAAGNKTYLPSPDGRAIIDHRLKGKEDWMRLDQVSADTKEEAETKATRPGLFDPSEKVALRDSLDKNDIAFFTSHFNTNATHPGPCVGSGMGTGIVGSWINDSIRKDCFDIEPPVAETTTTGSDQYQVVKTTSINITWFSPNIGNNTCDSSTGGGAGVAGGGMYAMANGRVVWTDGKGNTENYVFAEPTSNNVIPWDQRNQLAVVIPGFNNNQPIKVRDHYKTGLHAGLPYLDLMAPCNERASVPTGTRTVQIVDLTKPITTTSANTSSQAAPATTSIGAKRTIVIDPGHGSAANSNAPHEGPIELATGLKLASDLKAEGYNVVMTHSTIGEAIGGVTSGANKDDVARAQIANNANADLTIRLHANDTTSSSFMTLYPGQSGTDVTGHNGPANTSVITGSKKLAADVTSALSSAGFSGKSVTEGSSTGRSILIFSTYTKSPVVTLELYGYNSASLVAKYKDSATQAQVATALAKAVDTYEGSNKPTAGNQNPTLIAGASSKCPPQAPAAGPAEGSDYRAQIAQAFEKQLDQSAPEVGDTTLSSDGSGNYAAPAGANGNVLAVAKSQVGYVASRLPSDRPGHHNNGTKYGNGTAQWCAYFVTWVYQHAGYSIPSIGKATSVLDWFKSHGHATENINAAAPGDIVVWQHHIGIVSVNNPSSQTMSVIEGNADNGAVHENSYNYAAIKTHTGGLVGFGRW